MEIVALAHVCGAPRGQKEIAGFAKRLSDAQRRALGIRRNRRTGTYPSPSQPTLCRLLRGVDPLKVEQAILAFQQQLRGPAPKQQVVAIDGKQPKHSRGQHVVTAAVVPSQYYLGSAPVDTKTNEIPVVRELIGRLDLDGCLVGLDALHTQLDTARELVQDCGADYLLTVKGNQQGLRRTLSTLLTPPRGGGFSPSTTRGNNGSHRGTQSQSYRNPPAPHSPGHPRAGLLPGSRTGRPALPQNRRPQPGNRLDPHQP
jgi:hypothetical protein